jgi:hypothetical protein
MQDYQRAEVNRAFLLVVDSFDYYEVPAPYRAVIVESFLLGLAGKWNIYNMDGCTCVPDLWPNKFTPSCTPHDGFWRMGMGGYMIDRVFTEINKSYKLPKSKVRRRFIGVRIGWIFAYKWKHLFNGNVSKPTETLIKAYEYYKLSKQK